MMKPLFVIKKNLQKSKQTHVTFDQLVTEDILKEICQKLLGRTDCEIKYVDDNYADEWQEKGYNVGRLATLRHQGDVYYITFSEKKANGRDSSVQSIGPAYERFLRSKGKQFCYFFLDASFKITEYQRFMYRLMKSIGVNFLNNSQEFAPFSSLDDIMLSRKHNRDNGRANNSSYIIKGDAYTFIVYGKMYGANKYAAFLICYAMSKIANQNQKIVFYEMQETGLTRLPEPARKVLELCSNVTIEETNQSIDEKVIESNDDNIRNPRFALNLTKYLGQRKCAFCDCDVYEAIDAAHILEIASIKKERISKKEKIDKAVDQHNGMWLCKNHHRFFDCGMIQISDKGKIMYDDGLGNRERYIKSITKTTELDSRYLKPKFFAYLKQRKNSFSR